MVMRLIIVFLHLCLVWCQERPKLFEQKKLCQSADDSWKCCIATPKLFNQSLSACTDLKYLKRNMGVRMKTTFNDIVTYDEEISLRNPPPVCSDLIIQGMPKALQLCVRFYDLDTENMKTVSGCARLESGNGASFNYKIGCFKFPKEGNLREKVATL